MDNLEQEFILDGELDLGDFSLDLGDESEIEQMEVNNFVSEDSVYLAKEMVNYSLDRSIRVLALNRSISIILNSSAEKSKAKADRNAKAFYATMKQDSLLLADTIKNNLNVIYQLCDLFRREIGKLKVEYNHSLQLEIDKNLISNAIMIVNNLIPKNIGPSLLKTQLSILNQMATTDSINMQTIELMEKILKEFEMVAQTMSEYDIEDSEHISNSNDFISDNLVLNNEDTISEAEKYQLSSFLLEDQIVKLIQIRESLNTTDVFAEDIPSVYALADFSISQDTVKYVNATGTLVMSTNPNAPQSVTLNYMEECFSNRMHLIGITDKTVLVSIENGVNSSSILQIYTNEYNSLLERYQVTSKGVEIPSIIDVPPVYYSEALNCIILVDRTSEDCSCELFGKYVGDTKPEKSNMEILLDIAKSRGFSENPVYYTVLTANSTNCNFARNTRSNRQSVIKTWNLKYSNPDLGKIALQRNIRKLLEISASECKPKIIEKYHMPLEQEEKDKLIDVYTKMTSDVNNWKPTIEAYSKKLKLKKPMVYSKDLTFNRNRLVNIFYEHLQSFKGRVPSRLTLEQIYYENKEQIHARIAHDMLTKAEYEITSLREILGPACDYDFYFKEVLEKTDSAKYLMKKNLYPINIADILWLMLKLYKNGLIHKQIINKNTETIQTLTHSLTPVEFVRFVVNVASKPTCLDDIWSYTVPNEKIGKKLDCYNFIRQALAQAYGMFFLIKDNIEEVNKLMYNVKNLTVKQYQTIAQSDLDLMSKYGLTEEFYTSYMDYITKQVNGVVKANDLEFPTEISCELIGKAYIEFMWNTRKEDKDFSHQLANIAVKKLPTTHQLLKHSTTAGNKINAFISLRNEISNTKDVVDKYLNLCGLNITKPNEVLSNLINQCIYMVSINVVYAYELHEYLISIAINKNLDHFSDKELKEFNVLKGFDGCNRPIATDNVFLGAEYDKAFVMGKELFAIRDTMLLSQLLNKKFVRGLRKVSGDEQEAIVQLNELFTANTVNFTMEKALKKLLIKLGTINKDDIVQSLKHICNTLATTWDEICLVQSLALAISTTETTHKYTIDMSRVTIKPDKNIKEVEEELLKLQEEASSLLRKGDILNILASYIACSVIIDNNDKLDEVYSKVQDLINENYNSIEDLIVRNERSLKKSIALYRQYLKKGDPQYLTEVDMNAIPFDLLTKESSDNAATGHYSKSYLKTIYPIVDEENPLSVSSYYKTEFCEIFDSIMEREPYFYEEAPVAIKEYILEQERFNRSIVAGNFK